MARDRVSTDNRPESRDRGLRLQTDWDPNLAPRPRFWSDLPIGAEPGFNTGSGTPLCDFGTAEVGRWWFILHFNILYFSISPHPPETIRKKEIAAAEEEAGRALSRAAGRVGR